MNHCKDCKHFRGAAHFTIPLAGACQLADSTYGKADHPESLVVAASFHNVDVVLLVSPDFGCVQFEPKALKEPVVDSLFGERKQ